MLSYPLFYAVQFNYYYGFLPGVNVTEFPTSQGFSCNITELHSDINVHNRVWLVEETSLSTSVKPLDINQTVQTLKLELYNTTFQKSYFGHEVYLFEKQA